MHCVGGPDAFIPCDLHSHQTKAAGCTWQADAPVAIAADAFDKVNAYKQLSAQVPSSGGGGTDPGIGNNQTCAQASSHVSVCELNFVQGSPTDHCVCMCVCVSFVTFFWDLPHCPSLQNKDHFKRFMESMLKNVTKLKTLKRDLTSHYTTASIDPSAPHHVLQKCSQVTGQNCLGHPRSIKLLNDHIAKLEQEYDLLQEEVAKGETSDFGSGLEAYPMTNWKSEGYSKSQSVLRGPNFFLLFL